MDAPGRSEASCSAPIPAPGSSSNLKNASKARATTSPPRKFKPHRRGPASASSPSKRAVTRATSHKFDIKLHSPIPSYPPISRKSAELPSTASIEAPTQPEPATNEGVTESSSSSSDGPSRASSRNIFSLPSLTSPRPGSSDVFGAHNPLVRGSGLGLSPERSPTTSRARPAVAVENEWNSTSTSSGKRSSVVYEEDQHDLSFDIASPQKRTAQSIFARSPLSHGHSTRLVDPVPVGVAGKRRRDAFDLVDLDALEGNDNNSSNRDPWSHLRSTSPVRKRVAFTQPGSVSPKMRHLRSPPASPEKHRASPTKREFVPTCSLLFPPAATLNHSGRLQLNLSLARLRPRHTQFLWGHPNLSIPTWPPEPSVPDNRRGRRWVDLTACLPMSVWQRHFPFAPLLASPLRPRRPLPFFAPTSSKAPSQNGPPPTTAAVRGRPRLHRPSTELAPLRGLGP